ncbi:MAG: hypothetical protein AAGJ52_11725, partial [Pseudomonadota bacterium]
MDDDTTNKTERWAMLATLKRVFGLLRASAGRISVVASVTMLLEIAFAVTSLYLVKLLIDEASGHGGAGLPPGGVPELMWQVAALGLSTLLFLIFRAQSSMATEMQGMKVADHVQGLIHERAIAAPLSFYESPKYFDTLHRARQAGASRPAQVTGNLLNLVRSVLMLKAVVIMLVSINALLVPLILAAIVPALWVRLHFTRKLHRWRHERTPHQRRAQYLDWLLTSDTHAKEVRLFGLGEHLSDRHADLRRDLREGSHRIHRHRTLVELIMAVAAGLAFILALGYLLLETSRGHHSLGDLALFLLIFQRAQSVGPQLVRQVSVL